MSTIKDGVTRAIIWRNMWLQVMDLKLSSVDFFNFMLSNSAYEPVE